MTTALQIPCPRCGETAGRVCQRAGEVPGHFVRCFSCHLRLPFTVTREQAVEAWRERTAQATARHLRREELALRRWRNGGWSRSSDVRADVVAAYRDSLRELKGHRCRVFQFTYEGRSVLGDAQAFLQLYLTPKHGFEASLHATTKLHQLLRGLGYRWFRSPKLHHDNQSAGKYRPQAIILVYLEEASDVGAKAGERDPERAAPDHQEPQAAAQEHPRVVHR